MPYAKYSPREVESRARDIYEKEIRSRVESENVGRFIVIDVETGQFEIAEDDLHATRRMLERLPNAVLFGMWIGNQAAYTLGGHFDVVES